MSSVLDLSRLTSTAMPGDRRVSVSFVLRLVSYGSPPYFVSVRLNAD